MPFGQNNNPIQYSCCTLLGASQYRSGPMQKVLSKLGANDRTHAVAIALKRGIIEI